MIHFHYLIIMIMIIIVIVIGHVSRIRLFISPCITFNTEPGEAAEKHSVYVEQVHIYIYICHEYTMCWF